MKRIFISYRRADTQMAAGRLRDSLVHRFGTDSVFRDKEAMRPGYDWMDEIQNALSADAVVLALIGPLWAEAKDAAGGRRLDDPEDANRLELEIALAKNVPLVPVLVEDASIPTANVLPASLSSLTRRHAVRLRDDDWDADFSRLAEALHALGVGRAPAATEIASPPELERRRALRLMAIGGLGIAAAGGATWIGLNQFRSENAAAPRESPSSTPAPTTPVVGPAAAGSPRVSSREEKAAPPPPSNSGSPGRREPEAVTTTTTASTVPRGMQASWRRCSKCQMLWYAGDKKSGVCPAGEGHRASVTEYYIHMSVTGTAQGNWRYCDKCQALWYSGNQTSGVCPQGGGHEESSTTDYAVDMSVSSVPGGEDEWRFCTKCQGLWYSGTRTKGTCPATGAHSDAGSGNYVLRAV